MFLTPFTMTNDEVGTDLEDLAPVYLDQGYTKRGLTNITFELANGHGSVALADFALLVQPHPSAGWHTIISGSTWNTVAGNLKEVVGTLNTLAAGASGFAHVSIGPVYGFKFQAKSASGTVPVTIYGSGYHAG